MIGRDEALGVALEAEKAGLAYYQSILDSTEDPEIRALAREFVDEETHARQRTAALDFSGFRPGPGTITLLQTWILGQIRYQISTQ